MSGLWCANEEGEAATERVILRQALDTYGLEHQRNICIEEMSELTKELCKDARGNDVLPHIAEEIADVKLILQQMEIGYGIEHEVAQWYGYKLERLRQRMEGLAE